MKNVLKYINEVKLLRYLPPLMCESGFKVKNERDENEQVNEGGKNPFHTVIPVNCCKITGTTLSA